MPSTPSRAVAGVLAAAFAVVATLTASAQQNMTVKNTYGAWSVVCDTPPGASYEQCIIMQNVVAEDRENLGLSVVVIRTADRKEQVIRVLAPLGVLLLPPQGGLGLYIDKKEIGKFYFKQCFQDGCFTEEIFDGPLLAAFKAGKEATFIVFAPPERDGIGIPVDLTGFNDALAALP